MKGRWKVIETQGGDGERERTPDRMLYMVLRFILREGTTNRACVEIGLMGSWKLRMHEPFFFY